MFMLSHPCSDIIISLDGKSFAPMIERQEMGDDRLYTVTIDAVGGGGNAATASFQVQVSHRKHGEAIDSGSVYTVTL